MRRVRGAHETKPPLGPQDSACGSDTALSTSPAFQVPSPPLMEQGCRQTSDRPRDHSLTECGQRVQSCRKPTLPGCLGSNQGRSGREAVRQANRGGGWDWKGQKPAPAVSTETRLLPAHGRLAPEGRRRSRSRRGALGAWDKASCPARGEQPVGRSTGQLTCPCLPSVSSHSKCRGITEPVDGETPHPPPL